MFKLTLVVWCKMIAVTADQVGVEKQEGITKGSNYFSKRATTHVSFKVASP